MRNSVFLHVCSIGPTKVINFLRRGHQQPSIARFLSGVSDFKLSGKLKVVHNMVLYLWTSTCC